MLTCDRCSCQMEIFEAKFVDNEALCECCAANNGVTIGGLPSPIFELFVGLVPEKRSNPGFDLVDAFLAIEEVSESFRIQAAQLDVLFFHSDFINVDLESLNNAIHVCMFFSNMSREDAENALRTGKTEYDEQTIELACEIVFNY
ncbi:hypothetical protein [Vibrio metschnikovii]|uniref:Uncharacterized protein n=1 Tax=Vibrio metschnikovii TaxID=28172 RepID=A0A9X0RBK5_VIBME|nr:hypothetical protein [Vibrio metschnikovii]MBC5853387.1 hypothetical protein [Vibrio metschnikovii]